MTGCSLFRGDATTRPEVTAPEEPSAPPVAPPVTQPVTPPAPEPTERPRGTKSPGTAGPTSRPSAPVDTVAVVPEPVEAPQVTVRLTAEQRSVREMEYRENKGRAGRALDAVRLKPLTTAQRDQLGSADRFLADAAVAFDVDDLLRACSLAEKARILAEELKASVAP